MVISFSFKISSNKMWQMNDTTINNSQNKGKIKVQPARQLNCKVATVHVPAQGNQTIESEVTYDLGVTTNVKYFCKLYFADSLACFVGFDPTRDPPNVTDIYWLPKKDGLFYSYDKITYNDGPK
ncbi:hypothetical protein P3S67_028271 [Capsicum chacoense]